VAASIVPKSNCRDSTHVISTPTTQQNSKYIEF
jgi:hypothetical protein